MVKQYHDPSLRLNWHITFEQYFTNWWLCWWKIGIEIKMPSFGCKVLFCYVLTEKWQHRWIRTSRNFGLFGARTGLLHFVTIREDAFGEDYVLKFCGRTYSEVWQGKPRVTWHQIKPIYIWYLKLVVKHLHCINCLNSWPTNWITFWNQKLCSGTVFLNKNDETKNFPGL